jgi:peptidoglycan/LPS O-acetylase OafA/YrhL
MHSGWLGCSCFIISGLVTESYCRHPARPLPYGGCAHLSCLVNVLVCAPAQPIVARASAPISPAAELGQFLVATLSLDPGPLHLPGVLFADNPVGLLVNGSLWTLRYEVMMYLMILLLAAARLLRPASAIVLVAIGIAAVYFEQSLPKGDIGEWAWFVGFFASGMVLSFLRDRLVFDWRYALLAAAALVGFVWLGRFIMLFPLAGAYLVIWFARRHDSWLDYSKYCGDLSYGLYIYGWPAEQLVMYLSGGTAQWWQVFVGSLGLALPAAWLSWHGIGKWAFWGRAFPPGRLPPQPAAERAGRKSAARSAVQPSPKVRDRERLPPLRLGGRDARGPPECQIFSKKLWWRSVVWGRILVAQSPQAPATSHSLLSTIAGNPS